ncbi:hypothetical protein [Streptomyces cellulosae]|uniref:Serine/arginine repetitive matrix protein 2 n=1 Tax=Streptomyces cellulosae TaxID=1968 RepID=A0ABW7Y6C5_STRCE
MGGGARYWNEETQRWEDGEGTGRAPVDDPAWSPTEVSWSGPVLPGQPGQPGQVGGGSRPAGSQLPPPPSLPYPAPASVPTPTPAPTPTPGVSRRLVWSVLLGAAVLGAIVSLVLTLVVSGDDAPSAAPVASESSPPAEVSRQSDPRSAPAGETASPSASVRELPAGYEWYDDPEGFRMARPKGWTRGTVPSRFGMAVVNYRSADREHRLQIYQVAEEAPDASFDLFLSDRTAKADSFEEVSLRNLDHGEFTGSRLEYLVGRIKGEPDVGTWHVYDERFVAADGGVYAIAAYGPEADGRDDELELLTAALENFCPPSAC